MYSTKQSSRQSSTSYLSHYTNTGVPVIVRSAKHPSEILPSEPQRSSTFTNEPRDTYGLHTGQKSSRYPPVSYKHVATDILGRSQQPQRAQRTNSFADVPTAKDSNPGKHSGYNYDNNYDDDREYYDDDRDYDADGYKRGNHFERFDGHPATGAMEKKAEKTKKRTDNGFRDGRDRRGTFHRV